jgi:quercetin dioxygenase-like cupin family protein
MSATEDSHPSGAVQQAPGLWRTDLQRQDLSAPGREMVQSRVDIGPEAPLVKHTHPGEEIIYVLEGSLEYQLEGQPPRTFHAGEALTVPAGVVHAVRPNSPPTSPRKESRSSRWSSDPVPPIQQSLTCPGERKG